MNTHCRYGTPACLVADVPAVLARDIRAELASGTTTTPDHERTVAEMFERAAALVSELGVTIRRT